MGSSSPCAIAVMAKASEPGRTKTRLVPPLTFEEAAAFNTAFLQDVALNLLTAAGAAGIAGYMAYAPPGAAPFFRRTVPTGIGLLETCLPDFGDCLFKAADDLLAAGHAAACLLNADSPTLPTAILVETARVLAPPGDRVVIGPSSDGGYYLLGVKRPHRRLFEEIDWSTERVLRQTRGRAEELGLETHVLPEWYDVDDAPALRTLYGELFRDQPYGAGGLQPFLAPNTADLLVHGLIWTDLADRLDLDAAPADAQPA